MKILFINRVIGLWRGGGETFDLNIAGELQKLGCEVEFITGKSLMNKIKHPVQKIRTHYIYSPYIRDVKNKIPLRGMGRFFLLDAWLFGKRSLSFLDKYLKNNKVDIVQITADPLLCDWITKRYGIPSIVVFHGPPDRWYEEAIKRCIAVVSLGDAYKQIKKIRSDVVNIPAGIKLSSVDNNEIDKISSMIRTKYNILENERIILFVGRLIKIKNIPFLTKGFKKVLEEYSNVKLLIGSYEIQITNCGYECWWDPYAN
jgi:glycosyltransferase involved in cell wall biosynthesis